MFRGKGRSMKHRAPKRGVRRFLRLPRMRFLPRFVRWPVLILGAAVVVGTAGTTLVAYAFDRADSHQILPGIKVAGGDPSSRPRYRAVRAVRAELEPALRRPL